VSDDQHSASEYVGRPYSSKKTLLQQEDLTPARRLFSSKKTLLQQEDPTPAIARPTMSASLVGATVQLKDLSSKMPSTIKEPHFEMELEAEF